MTDTRSRLGQARAQAASESSKRQAAQADLAYEMARWPRHQYDREVSLGGNLADAQQARNEGTWQAFTRELFGRLYGMGTRRKERPSEGAEWAEELHRQADAVPEWSDLAGHVQGDAWKSGLGAAAASLVLADRMPPLPEEDAASLLAERDFLNEIMSKDGKRVVNSRVLAQQADVQRRLRKAKDAAEAALNDLKGRNGVALRSALREAARAGSAAIESFDESMDGLGWGKGNGTPQRRAVAARLANNDKLKAIAMLAGRLRAQARAKQKTKVDRQREEFHGVDTGDDISRLLASEVGLLTRPASKSLLLMRLVEKRCLQYKIRGRETKARGPIIFVMDVSGSMMGSREVWAKAAALAMMEIARIQKRAFAIVYFSGSVQAEYRFDPKNVDEKMLLDALEFFSGGGTTIASGLERAVDLITSTGSAAKDKWVVGEKADVVLVSDGVDGGSRSREFARLKEAGASLYMIAIECAAPGDIETAAEAVVAINHGDMAGPSHKLDPVFSV